MGYLSFVSNLIGILGVSILCRIVSGSNWNRNKNTKTTLS